MYHEALFFLQPRPQTRVGDQRHVPATLPSKTTRYPLYRRLCGTQERAGRVQKISPPTGTRTPDRPAGRQSLYWLSHPGPLLLKHNLNIFKVLILCVTKDYRATAERVKCQRMPTNSLRVVKLGIRSDIRQERHTQQYRPFQPFKHMVETVSEYKRTGTNTFLTLCPN
jgi:hypothetical protein